MNQDSDQNDRRDGESRSFGRRDDGPRFNRQRNDESRDSNADRPRFNRSNDRFDSDKPRFSRDTNRDDKPRFNKDRNDRSDNDRPRFNRDDKRSDSFGDRRPRFDRDRNDERPRFNRDDKPRFDRDRNDNPRGGRREGRSDDSRRNSNDERPRFNRDDKPGFDRSNNRFGNERRFNDRNDERPRSDRNSNRFGDKPDRFSENDRPRFNRDDKPRFDRNDERPRFNREDKPRFDRNDERPRFNRDDKPRFDRNDERPRFNRDDKPRFDRDRNADSDKPKFKRVGGFQRDADERNRFDRDEKRSGDRRSFRNRDDQNEAPRFSPEQRKESGDRRIGRYSKAPDYNLEQIRTERYDKPRAPRTQDENDRPKRTKTTDDGLTRLNRYIANSGVCSRREADELIARGDISVNGKVVTEMGFKVKEGDTVKYGTKTLNPERFVYVLLNKPKDYITTTEDPEERKTVMELVADAGNFRMYPVGRLDRNTTGLLLLTNDGELADKLTHPSNNIRKIYQVELSKPITNEDFETIQQGITLEDGPIKPDALSIVTPDAYVVGIEIHSGRNRIVRRIFEHLGYEVTKLDRTTYAGLTKKDLPRGKWRFLDPKEVVKLKYFN